MEVNPPNSGNGAVAVATAHRWPSQWAISATNGSLPFAGFPPTAQASSLAAAQTPANSNPGSVAADHDLPSQCRLVVPPTAHTSLAPEPSIATGGWSRGALGRAD